VLVIPLWQACCNHTTASTPRHSAVAVIGCTEALLSHSSIEIDSKGCIMLQGSAALSVARLSVHVQNHYCKAIR
jgi:hypothetical protein